MSAVSPTPWGRLLQAGLRLGLTPEAFWRLSLREWQLMSSTRQSAPLGRKHLEDLMAAFPDKETQYVRKSE